MIHYYITDRSALGGQRGVLRNLERLADTIDYVQVREKDLTARQLEQFVREVLSAAHPSVRVLVNDRADVAMACGAHGVHLRSQAIAPTCWRGILREGAAISVACHSVEDVMRAEREGADMALLAPIFDTPGKGPAMGLDVLGEAARAVSLPVIALGGVTWQSLETCRAAGAAGIAAIRLFQEPRGLLEAGERNT